MRIFPLFILALGAVTLSGCATIMSGGSSQKIHVQAVNSANNKIIPNAACSIRDGSGNFYRVVGNPGVVNVTRGKGNLTVTCHKVGYSQSKVGASDSFNAWTLGNIIFWPGAIVDAVSGTIVKYPSYITVEMAKR